MQLRVLASLVIFLGSYLPLTLILLAQDTTWKISCELSWRFPPWADQCAVTAAIGHPGIALSALCATLTCLLLTLGVLRTVKTTRNVVIREAKHIPTDLMNYVLPYIVSFMGLEYGVNNKLAGFLIFLFWIFWISHQSGRVIFNPVLIAFRWKLYEIKYSHEGSSTTFTGFALSRKEIHPDQVRPFAQLQDVLIVKE